MVIEELDSQDKEGALKEMVSFLKRRKKISKEKELYGKLLQREELGSTAIGEGVAIPHCKMKGVKNPIVLLAISRKSIDFQSLDGNPSNIFFLVVSSPDNPSLNLQILAAIASLVRKSESLLKKILNAKNVSTILEIIREEEEKLSEQR
ncbi:MAG: PTS sugar transporter subunit IIA [Candidatus Aminicenantes bacterium]|jgi:PTS system nitrogen regulatory IIA component|nr:PTS sugar transporter subunit IIA [Candidatus Aminicenantes bacterium]MCK4760126.1 PTS sugar transporter subunit IIA [Candidatus Aminicenantes bacterium]